MTDDLFDISGKVALVTGGTSGIGLMIARALTRRGAITYIAGRNASHCDAVATQLASLGHCAGLAADLGTIEGVAGLAAAFAAQESRLHILVNNAGANDRGNLGSVNAGDWDDVMNVNLRAAFFLTQSLLPQLRAEARAEDPGRIINIGSIGGLHIPAWDAFAYGASKAGLHHLTRALAKRLGRDHVTCNAIAPGPFPSKLTDTGSDSVKASVQAHIPLGRPGEPQDIEGLVVFLASRAGAYVNGATIPLDGGYLAAL